MFMHAQQKLIKSTVFALLMTLRTFQIRVDFFLLSIEGTEELFGFIYKVKVNVRLIWYFIIKVCLSYVVLEGKESKIN